MELDFSIISDFFGTAIGIILLLIVAFFAVIWVIDRTQTKHSVRRNYPIIGRMRWYLEDAGHFFRAYFITGAKEPISKESFIWSVKAGKGNKTNESFGSSLHFKDAEFAFIHSPYPIIPKTPEDKTPTPITYGENTENPYTSPSRINISGMSYGALSDVAVLSLSLGAAKGGFLMNTGEGGLSKFHVEGGADIIFQIGTAKYGCDNEDLTLNTDKLTELAKNDQIKMFEIKLSQGAKPGKGGILPAEKVNKDIAEARGIKVGIASISPNRHVEADNDLNLLNLIYKVKKHSKKPTGIKLCLGSEEHLDDLFTLMNEKIQEKDGHLYIPDFITLDSSDGGTGAAPIAHMDVMGMHIKESLPVLVSKLNEYNLKRFVKVICSGKLITPIEAGWAFASGADSINVGRGFLFNLGCIQARKCSKNTCPTGVTTHNKRFTKGLVPAAKHLRVYNYHKVLTKELMDISHSCGLKSFDLLNSKHIRKVNHINIKMVS
jgi:glutamate synthase domain-containing protein 2